MCVSFVCFRRFHVWFGERNSECSVGTQGMAQLRDDQQVWATSHFKTGIYQVNIEILLIKIYNFVNYLLSRFFY